MADRRFLPRQPLQAIVIVIRMRRSGHRMSIHRRLLRSPTPQQSSQSSTVAVTVRERCRRGGEPSAYISMISAELLEAHRQNELGSRSPAITSRAFRTSFATCETSGSNACRRSCYEEAVPLRGTSGSWRRRRVRESRVTEDYRRQVFRHWGRDHLSQTMLTRHDR